MEEIYSNYLSFRELFDALPRLVEEGDQKLQHAFDHTRRLMEDATNNFHQEKINEQEFNDQTKDLFQLQEKINTKRGFVYFTGNRLQQELRFLAFHCGDTSIPAEIVPMPKENPNLPQPEVKE